MFGRLLEIRSELKRLQSSLDYLNRVAKKPEEEVNYSSELEVIGKNHVKRIVTLVEEGIKQLKRSKRANIMRRKRMKNNKIKYALDFCNFVEKEIKEEHEEELIRSFVVDTAMREDLSSQEQVELKDYLENEVEIEVLGG